MLRRLIAITLCCLLLAQPAYAWKRFGGGYKQQVSASDIETDTTNFSGNLTSSDTDVQKVIDKFDDFVASGGGYATVQDEGSALTQRTKLNFIGSGVSCVDDAGNTRTNCTITSGGGTGDVVGPASATDNALVRFDSTTGKLIQDSGAILSDANALSGVATLDTGQGANELYDMDQNVLTTSSPTFAGATLTGDLELGNTPQSIDGGTQGVAIDPDNDGTNEVTIDTTGKISADGGFTAGAGPDPSLTFDVVTAGDTDFWAGVQDDAGGDDDDSFQIGTGTTVGSNTRLTLDKDGNLTTYYQSDLRFADADGSHYVGFQSDPTVASSILWTLPDADSSGCFKSDGLGVMSIGACGGGSITGTDTHVTFFDGTDNPAGDAGFTYNKTTDSATLVGDLTLNGHDLVMGTSTNGVTLTDDGDGQLTIAAKSTDGGTQENLTLNLDDTSNQGVFGTSTGLNQLTLGADGSGISLGIANDVWLIFGISGVNAQMAWESTNTVDDFQIGVRVGSNSTGGFMSLMERADMGVANRSPSAFATHPTFRVYSADAGTDNNGYIQLYHDETDGYIDVGSGVVSILDPTSVTGALSSTTTVTAGTNLVAGSTSGDGTLVIHDDDAGGDATVTIQALDATGTGYTLTLPPNDGTSGQVLHTDGSGVLTWDTDDTGAGGGDPVLIDGVAVSDGSGVDLIGGTNGIDIAFNAGVSPDTATFNLDLSEISAGDLANASVVEDDLAASLAFDDGDFLDLSSINASSTTEGIKLPQNTSCASATSEGQVCWDTDGDDLYIGDGTTAQQMNGTGGSGAKIIPLPIMQAKITGAYVTATITGVDVSTQGAQLDAGDGNWRLLFDATTDESAVWQVIVPDNYTSTPVIKIIYSMTSGNANEVEWEGAVMCVPPGTAADVGTASFATAATAVETVPGTAGHTDSLVSITPTDDSCAAGALMYVYISTDADDATNDDATGDRELVGAYVSYT